MLYELGAHKIDLPGVAPESDENSKIILWYQGQVLLNDRDIAWPYSGIDSGYLHHEFIAVLDGKAYFSAKIDQLPNPSSLSSLRDIAYLSETAFMLCARARALFEWRAQHRYCGQCGKVTTKISSEFSMQCEPCRLRFYPRIAPCIIVLVTRGNEILLAQGERHRESGWFSTLAGFIESGESAEQAVIREVKEEVSIDVKNVKYLNSQAWPFPNQLMLGFHAEYDGGDIVPEKGEIAEADWFDLEKLPKHPPGISIAGWLIRQYIDQRVG